MERLIPAAFASALLLLAIPAAGLAAEPATALQPEELDQLSGGANGDAVAISNQNLQAVNSGNRVEADQVITGAVSISSGALTGFSGIGNFVMNSGNNNNLQSTMSVTIVMPSL